jgi:hypothetical protein
MYDKTTVSPRLSLTLRGERRPLSYLDIVGDAFTHLQRTVIASDLGRPFRQAAIVREVLSGNGNHESVNIGHGKLLRFPMRKRRALADDLADAAMLLHAEAQTKSLGKR